MGRRFLEQDEHRTALRIARSTRAGTLDKDDYRRWIRVEQDGAGLS